ncbi:hypothetical protein AAC03nite_37190 [Alicyclobacillus acidoterrestris]|nr:hypothetical protein N007_12215 [Alicyclobacillus acidoterrestris ATCC 49025]GEO27934.1 hypothetical protein AAC03nite_37190 [Alicyclobacillus acidoterrestris]
MGFEIKETMFIVVDIETTRTNPEVDIALIEVSRRGVIPILAHKKAA